MYSIVGTDSKGSDREHAIFFLQPAHRVSPMTSQVWDPECGKATLVRSAHKSSKAAGIALEWQRKEVEVIYSLVA